MVGVPENAIPAELLRPIEGRWIKRLHGRLALTLSSPDEDWSDWTGEEEDDRYANANVLSALVALRAEFLAGDMTLPWLAWLLESVGDDDSDAGLPPIPAALHTHRTGVRTVLDFVGMDPDLMTVLFEEVDRGAPPPARQSRREVLRWLEKQPAEEKESLLAELILGDAQALNPWRLRWRTETAKARDVKSPKLTVGELLDRADARREEREKAEAEAQRRRAEQERLAREARRRSYLESLRGREDFVWEEIETAAARKNASGYAVVCTLVADLREIAKGPGKRDFAERLADFKERHAAKRTLIDKLMAQGD